MRIIAHRGDSGSAPENTLIAFQSAKQKGADWVEFDVMLSADEIPIVFHDSTLNRTTNGSGRVAKHTYAQIRQLNAGSWFAERFQTELVPSLEQVLLLLQSLNLNANIEIKPTSADYAIKTTEIALRCIQSLWRVDSDRLLISSFDLNCIHYAFHNTNQYPRGLLLHRWRKNWYELAQRYRCDTIHLNARIVNRARIKTIKNFGYQVLVYTVNDPIQAKRLEEDGVDGVFTDYPELLIKTT